MKDLHISLFILLTLFLFCQCKVNKGVVEQEAPKAQQEQSAPPAQGLPSPDENTTKKITAVKEKRDTVVQQSPPVCWVEGKITDRRNDKPILDGEIKIISKETGEVIMVEIGRDGAFSQVLPTPGCYEVQIRTRINSIPFKKEVCYEQNYESQEDQVIKLAVPIRADDHAHTAGPISIDPGEEDKGGDKVNGSTGNGSVVGPKYPDTESPINPPDPTINLNNQATANVNRIRTGTFKYDSIPPLPIDTNYFFQLEIIPGSDTTLFVSDNSSGTGSVSKPIRIDSEMSVNITSPDSAFQITQISSAIQPIDNQSSTTWSWMVIPRKLGKHPVIVSIDILTKSTLSGEIIKKSIKVFDEEVEVYVIEKDPPVVSSTNWLWWALPGALLLGLVGFFLFRKKKKENQEKQWTVSPALWGFLSEVEDEIAQGNTEEALNKLMDFFKENDESIHSELLVLSAEYNNYKRSFNLGLNPPAETVNRINLAVVELVNGVQAKVQKA